MADPEREAVDWSIKPRGKTKQSGNQPVMYSTIERLSCRRVKRESSTGQGEYSTPVAVAACLGNQAEKAKFFEPHPEGLPEC